MIGEMLGSYKVVSKLGEGGMGVVYVAEHPMIGRRVAIKLLLPELSRDQEIVARFFNEARSTASIRHAGLVDVFDFGYHGGSGSAFLVMELLEGESLGARLRREHRLSLGLALVVARQVAGALAAAHAKGIVHRDLKPDNLFLVPDRDVVGGTRVKVLDFGIAKLAADGAVPGAAGSGNLRTRTGTVMGTPLYMSPEQCKGAGAVDHRSDVYALGCILFECVCGKPPFGGDGFGEIIGKHMYEPPPPPRSLDPSLPPEVEAVILRTLAKPAAERYQSMQELEAALDRVAPALSSPGMSATAPPAGVAAFAPTLPPTAPGATQEPRLAGSHDGPMRPPPPSNTTLSGSAGQAAPPPAGRGARGVYLGAGALVVVGGAIAAILAGGRGSRGEPHAAGMVVPDAAMVAPARVVEKATPAPDAAPAVVAAPAPAAPPDAAVAAAVPPPVKPAPPAPPPPREPNLPETLSMEDVKQGIAKVRGSINSCVKLHDGDGVAQVTMTIDGSGRVLEAKVGQRLAGTPLGSCIESAVASASFRRWRGPQQILTYPVKLGAATDVAPAAPVPVPVPVPAPVPSANPDDDEDDRFVQLGNSARKAYLNGQYAVALRDAEAALALRANDPAVLTTATMAACRLKKAALARDLARSLPDSRRNMVRAACAESGITL